MAQGYEPYPIKIILGGYEGIRHWNSGVAQTFIDECQGAIAGFNFETGFRDNSVAVEKKVFFNPLLRFLVKVLMLVTRRRKGEAPLGK